ncbi:MAG: hypothetical protein WCJ27_02975 [Verrucomicrobiota bacterium]
MKTLLFSPWTAVLVCTILSTLTDTLGTLWWERKHPSLLIATIALSPLVFLSFGYIGSHLGLARASGLTNSLIVAGPILIGIIFRHELRQLALPQIFGMVFILIGITLLAFFKANPV